MAPDIMSVRDLLTMYGSSDILRACMIAFEVWGVH